MTLNTTNGVWELSAKSTCRCIYILISLGTADPKYVALSFFSSRADVWIPFYLILLVVSKNLQTSSWRFLDSWWQLWTLNTFGSLDNSPKFGLCGIVNLAAHSLALRPPVTSIQFRKAVTRFHGTGRFKIHRSIRFAVLQVRIHLSRICPCPRALENWRSKPWLWMRLHVHDESCTSLGPRPPAFNDSENFLQPLWRSEWSYLTILRSTNWYMISSRRATGYSYPWASWFLASDPWIPSKVANPLAPYFSGALLWSNWEGSLLFQWRARHGTSLYNSP